MGKDEKLVSKACDTFSNMGLLPKYIVWFSHEKAATLSNLKNYIYKGSLSSVLILFHAKMYVVAGTLRRDGGLDDHPNHLIKVGKFLTCKMSAQSI